MNYYYKAKANCFHVLSFFSFLRNDKYSSHREHELYKLRQDPSGAHCGKTKDCSLYLLFLFLHELADFLILSFQLSSSFTYNSIYDTSLF